MERNVSFFTKSDSHGSLLAERWRQEAGLTKQMGRAGRLPGVVPRSWLSSAALTSTPLVNLWARGAHSTFLSHQFNKKMKLELCSPSTHRAVL